MDARVIGERKRRRSSNGYGASGSDAVLRTAIGRAEATPFFERLWDERKRRRSSNGYGASGSDAVLRTAMPAHDDSG